MTLSEALQDQKLHAVLDTSLSAENCYVMDFTAQNESLAKVNLQDKGAFEAYVQEVLAMAKKPIGVGGYLEHRVLYQRSEHFDGAGEARSLHLGIDLWAPDHTPIYAPIGGKIHSFADNQGFGNYGPTVILEHQVKGFTFFTLYGHLSRASMPAWTKGKEVTAGEQIATLGDYTENGDWPAHLHFQVMTDMLTNEGDFPGVAPPSEKDFWQQVCPNPNLILGCEVLP